MLKRVLLAVLILVLLLAGFFFLRIYLDYKKDPNPDKPFLAPRVHFMVNRIERISDEKTVLISSVLIENRLPFGFKADSFTYRFLISDVVISESTYGKRLRIERGDSSLIELPITVFNKVLDSLVRGTDNERSDSVEYKVEMSFYGTGPLRKRFTISVKRYLPLIHIPEVEVDKVEFEEIEDKEIHLLLHLKVRNSNIYEIVIKDISYKFRIEGHEWIEGKIPGRTVLPEKSTQKIELPMNISLKGTGKALKAFIKDGLDMNYSLNFRFRLESEKKSINNSPVSLVMAGKVKTLVKMRKKERR